MQETSQRAQFDAVATWLAGPDARAAAHAELGRLRLPAGLADDLLQETACGLWRTMSRRDFPYEDFTAAAFARRSLRHTALNFLRAEISRPVTTRIDDEVGEEPADATDIATDVVSALARGTFEAAAQRHIFAGIDADAPTGSAALTSLVLLLHPEVTPADDTPRPEGTHAADPALWAGLWYAGRKDCFEGETDAADATVRRRRTRAVVRVRAALAGALPGEETADV